MPETLIEPMRPTVDDAGSPPPPSDSAPPTEDSPPPAPESGAPAKPPRRKVGWIAAAIAALATAIAAAIVAYFFLVRYEPTARRHIPGDANIAVRLEAADLILFAPIRKHLWPLLEDSAAGKSHRARIKEATGLDLALDLREIVVASTDATRWVALAGGNIPKGRFIRGLERVAREEAWVGFRREGDLLLAPRGLAIGQADDGTIALGTDIDVVKAALPASDEWQRLELPERGALTFALTRQAWSGVAGALGTSLPRSSVVLRRVDHASGTMALGDKPALTMRLSPVAGEKAATLATDVQLMLGEIRVVSLVLPDLIGEKAALRAAQVEAIGEAAVLRADWPYDGLDRACAKLAQTIRAAQALDVPASPAP